MEPVFGGQTDKGHTSIEKGSKLICDSVHGTIPLDGPYIRLLDNRNMQRLHRIKQSGMLFTILPSAVHDRFAHSLGTYYIGKIIVENFFKRCNYMFNAKSDHSLRGLEKYWKNYDKKRKEQIFCSACLLHDVGQAPFSHTLENYYRIGGDLSEVLEKKYNIRIDNNEPKQHEMMGAIIILDEDGEIYQELIEQQYSTDEINLLCQMILERV